MKMKIMQEKKLLAALNAYLQANSKAGRLQIKFENALAEFNGVERDELSMLMDTYIDFDIAGTGSATLEDLKQIIIESKEEDPGYYVNAR